MDYHKGKYVSAWLPDEVIARIERAPGATRRARLLSLLTAAPAQVVTSAPSAAPTPKPAVAQTSASFDARLQTELDAHDIREAYRLRSFINNYGRLRFKDSWRDF